MGLSAEQFEKIVAGLLGQCGLSERRREHRVSISAAVLLTPDAGNPGADHPPIHALLTDLSRGGAGLTHHAELAVGHRMRVHLPVKGEEPLAVPCDVRHCDLIRESWYLFGVAFLD
jgi:hypothetical protein